MGLRRIGQVIGDDGVKAARQRIVEQGSVVGHRDDEAFRLGAIEEREKRVKDAAGVLAYAEHMAAGFTYTDEETVSALAARFDSLRGECYRVSRSAVSGRYHQRTRKKNGKTAVRILTDDQAADYAPWLDNHRRPRPGRTRSGVAETSYSRNR
jgi:hypothetical protein